MTTQLSLRMKIYLSMLMVISISFVVIAIITVYHFKVENEEYHEARLNRKENAVIKSIGYFLEKEGIYKQPDSVVVLFSDKIVELADINNLDISIYNLEGELLISSQTEYFKEGVFMFNLGNDILTNLSSGTERIVLEQKADSITILSTYRYLKNPEGDPLAIINLPYFQSDETSKQEIKSFLSTLIQLYLILFAVTAVFAFLLSRYITSSLQAIQNKLKAFSLSKTNTKLEWESKDEIGALIKEYNRMVNELEKSAVLLAKSERESAWREMAKQVAHEIKNPLTPIKLRVQHIQRTLTPETEDFSNKLDNFSKSIIEQIDTLTAIADAFSNFANMPKASIQKCDLTDTISTTCELLGTGKTHVIFEKPTTPIYTLADKDQLTRIFNNIIKNAIQAIPENIDGIVSIKLETNQNKTIVSITDNGSGIPEELREQIFTPNFTTKTSGMGLGLAMVKNMLNNIDGNIWFETELNQGTIFYIELPQLK